ncbi:uncharacterized protein LOC135483826 [Lineus longissimus]|uniref:uncharacterized protein LOC135483826 n=1 Tax=Lineus longissimus TaxID=88925 RepID=UPI00315D51F2
MAQSVASRVAALRDGEHQGYAITAAPRPKISDHDDPDKGRHRQREREVNRLKQSMLAYTDKVKQLTSERHSMQSTGKFGNDLQVTAQHITRSSSLPRLSNRDRRVQWLREHFSRSNDTCMGFYKDRLGIDKDIGSRNNMASHKDQPKRPKKGRGRKHPEEFERGKQAWREGNQAEHWQVGTSYVLGQKDDIGYDKDTSRKVDTDNSRNGDDSKKGVEEEETLQKPEEEKCVVTMSAVEKHLKVRQVHHADRRHRQTSFKGVITALVPSEQEDVKEEGVLDSRGHAANLSNRKSQKSIGVDHSNEAKLTQQRHTKQEKLEEQFFTSASLRNSEGRRLQVDTMEKHPDPVPLSPKPDDLKKHWDTRKHNLSRMNIRKNKRRQKRHGVRTTELNVIPENSIFVCKQTPYEPQSTPHENRVSSILENIQESIEENDRFSSSHASVSNIEIVRDLDSSKDKMVINIKIMREPKHKTPEDTISATDTIKRIQHSLPEGTRLVLPPLLSSTKRKQKKIKRLRYLRDG